MRTIPIDSTDAREQRELEAEQAAADALERRQHAERCRAGWLGEDADGRPIVCPLCRPGLLHVPCRTCGATYEACNAQRTARRRPCCDACNHARRSRPAAASTQAEGVSPRRRESFERTDLLKVNPLPTNIGRSDRLLIVHDPALGTVPVRWRIPQPPATESWIWRCPACNTKSRTADCAHTFAAAITLSEHLLGLPNPIPARLTSEDPTA